MTRAKKLVHLIGDTQSTFSDEDRERIMELATMIEQIERNISRSLQYHANQNQLTLLDAQALTAIIELGDKARLSAIAEDVRMPLSTMTGVASRLEKAGLVERKRAADDGRASILSLTEEGLSKTREMFKPFFRNVSQVIDGTDTETLDKLIESFTIVNAMAEKLIESTEKPNFD